MLAKSDTGQEASLAQKVALLGDPGIYGAREPVTEKQTHMSWVFFVDSAVYKLKKPVRLPYLDFSTLARREAACRAEFTLNQKLAPGVYEGVVPLVRRGDALHLDGPGEVVDWLVRMRRMDEASTLESRIEARTWTRGGLDALAEVLIRFYRHASRVPTGPDRLLVRWRAQLAENEGVLLDPALGLPGGLVRRLIGLERRFLRVRSGLLRRRAPRIVDAHGDLRPEHIWIGSEAKIIDRLEFSDLLRAVDPLDELAFLDLECERLGAPAAGARVRWRVLSGLHAAPAPELYLFYRIYRALLRARLSIAHLQEPEPRTPEKWPRQARAYLSIAAHDARRLEVLLRTPSGP